MKRDYIHPSIDHVGMEVADIILNGSYTNKAIKVNTVEVDGFDNGFLVPDASGVLTGPEFQDITFD